MPQAASGLLDDESSRNRAARSALKNVPLLARARRLAKEFPIPKCILSHCLLFAGRAGRLGTFVSRSLENGNSFLDLGGESIRRFNQVENFRLVHLEQHASDLGGVGGILSLNERVESLA